MSLCCSSGSRQKQQELDEDFRQCLVLYNYAAKHELNSRRREAFIWYLRANSELELLKVKALLVCTREFKENLEKLMSTLKQRLPTCMGHCMDEVVDVLERLRQICKDGDSPSYEMRLFDVVTEFDRVMFLGRFSESECNSLLHKGEVEEYTDDEGDEVLQVGQNVLDDIAHQRIPVKKRRRPHRPRCQTKAFKDLMSAEQTWDSLKYLVHTEPLEVKWLDIVGYEDLKQNLQTKLADFVQRNREERHLGISGTRQKTLSVLLYGPVGTGKTQLAMAVAKEASECVFIQCKPSDLLAKYRGESPKSINLLFKMASDLGPSIIFMDECESLLARRSSEEVDGRSDITSQFLQNLSAFRNVSFLGATNLPWLIDRGYIRRFSVKYLVGLPTESQRAVMLKQIFGELFTVITDEEFQDLAKLTDKLSGSDIATAFDCLKSELVEEGNKARHFRYCPFRRNKVVPCSEEDADESVTKLRRRDIEPFVLRDRATTFEDIKKLLKGRKWATVDEKDLKLLKEYESATDKV